MAVAPEQVEDAHGVEAGYSEHVPKPSHTPVVPQVSTGVCRHSGWPLPADTGEHVPCMPTRLQDRQAPPQAVLQHTPSAQWPDAHSLSPIGHSAPFIFLPQLPAVHLRPETQSAFVAQVAKQLFGLTEVSHENGAQTVEGPSLHCPLPSQTLVFVTASFSQVPGLHTVPDSYLRHWPVPSQVPSRPHEPTSSAIH